VLKLTPWHRPGPVGHSPSCSSPASARSRRGLAGRHLAFQNHGVLRVGATLTEGEPVKIPASPTSPAPENLRRVRLEDPMSPSISRAPRGSPPRKGVTQVYFEPLDRRRSHRGAWFGELCKLDVLRPVEARNTRSDDPRALAQFRDRALDRRPQQADLEAFMASTAAACRRPRRLSGILARNAC